MSKRRNAQGGHEKRRIMTLYKENQVLNSGLDQLETNFKRMINGVQEGKSRFR